MFLFFRTVGLQTCGLTGQERSTAATQLCTSDNTHCIRSSEMTFWNNAALGAIGVSKSHAPPLCVDLFDARRLGAQLALQLGIFGAYRCQDVTGHAGDEGLEGGRQSLLLAQQKLTHLRIWVLFWGEGGGASGWLGRGGQVVNWVVLGWGVWVACSVC